MRNQKIRLLILILMFFILIPYAQTETNLVSRSIRIIWSGGEHALRYAIEIDKMENGVYQSNLREYTEALYFNVSLFPGEYRYRIIPHDVLDRPGAGTQWIRFEVHPVNPAIADSTVVFGDEVDDNEQVTSIQYTIISSVFNENGHRYEVIDESMTWTEAMLEARRRGGHLATITSATEQKFIEDLIADGTKNFYWLGAQRYSYRWRWVTNEPFQYTNWAPSQPDNSWGNQNSLMIMRVPNLSINAKRGQWDDVANDGRVMDQNYYNANQKGFIIEYPVSTRSENNEQKTNNMVILSDNANINPDDQLQEKNERIANDRDILQDSEEPNDTWFNTLGLSLGTDFSDTFINILYNRTFIPASTPNIYIEVGLDLGFSSSYIDNYSFFSYFNIGYFMPLNENIKLFISTGSGITYGEYSYSKENVDIVVLAVNLTVGFNIFDIINFSYRTLSPIPTYIDSTSNKISMSYMLKF